MWRSYEKYFTVARWLFFLNVQVRDSQGSDKFHTYSVASAVSSLDQSCLIIQQCYLHQKLWGHAAYVNQPPEPHVHAFFFFLFFCSNVESCFSMSCKLIARCARNTCISAKPPVHFSEMQWNKKYIYCKHIQHKRLALKCKETPKAQSFEEPFYFETMESFEMFCFCFS